MLKPLPKAIGTTDQSSGSEIDFSTLEDEDLDYAPRPDFLSLGEDPVQLTDGPVNVTVNEAVFSSPLCKIRIQSIYILIKILRLGVQSTSPIRFVPTITK